MVVANGLVPIWCQDICSHLHDVAWSVYIWESNIMQRGVTLQWCHMSNMASEITGNCELDCLFSSFTGLTKNNTSRLCITDSFWWEFTGGFPSQMAPHKWPVVQKVFPCHDIIIRRLQELTCLSNNKMAATLQMLQVFPLIKTQTTIMQELPMQVLLMNSWINLGMALSLDCCYCSMWLHFGPRLIKF